MRTELWGFAVYDKDGEEKEEEYAMTDTGELLKKNARGVWITVPDRDELVVAIGIKAARRW